MIPILIALLVLLASGYAVYKYNEDIKSTSSPTVLATSTPTVLATSTPTVLATSTPTVLATSTPTVLATSTPTVLATSTPISSIDQTNSDITGFIEQEDLDSVTEGALTEEEKDFNLGLGSISSQEDLDTYTEGTLSSSDNSLNSDINNEISGL
jgi:hypothetical protein